MSLIDQLTTDDAAARKTALATYAALLARQATPQAGDAESLRAVMATLDLTPSDVTADGAVVKSATEQDAYAAAAEAGDAALREQAEKTTAQLDAALKAYRDAQDEHRRAIGEHQNAARSAAFSKGEAGRLRRENPRAFGQEAPAPIDRHATRYVGGMQYHEEAIA